MTRLPAIQIPKRHASRASATKARSSADAGGVELEDGGKGFLGDVDAADALHVAFAGLLRLREFLLAGDIAAAGFG